MIAYADSSIVVRSIAPNEAGTDVAAYILSDPAYSFMSSTMTELECASAAARAARRGPGHGGAWGAAFDALFDPAIGVIALVDVGHADTARLAVAVARATGLRAMDAWHIACAELCFREFGEPGERPVFATRDLEQAAVARARGWTVI